MVYVSDEDFAIIRKQMANDMLEAARRSVTRYLELSIKGSFKGRVLAELLELAGSILTEKMDVWPEYCRENENTSEALMRRQSCDDSSRRWFGGNLSIPLATTVAILLIAMVVLAD